MSRPQKHVCTESAVLNELNYDEKAFNCNEEALKETYMHNRHGNIIKVRRGRLKRDVQALKDGEEVLKGNRESLRSGEVVIKGGKEAVKDDEEALKGDGKVVNDNG